MPDGHLPPYLSDETPSPGRAAYLLKADSGSMQRWRSAADAQGVTFAAHVRDALDNHYTPSVGTAAPAANTPSTDVGRWVPAGMVVVSLDCYTADHRACQNPGCECTCH